MKLKQNKTAVPEIAGFTRYYEQDGMLRAYANRAMFLAILFAVIAIGAIGFGIYTGIEPPTVIRIDQNGNATVVGGSMPRAHPAGLTLGDSAQAATGEPSSDPTDLEARAVVRRFLDRYLCYAPDSAARNLAESLNMMTANLRAFTMNQLREDDTIGKIQQDHVISDFRIRSIEPARDAPWDYIVFGVKEVHKVKAGTESTDRIVARYNVRLVAERRSERNPSGLLVAEYSEKQMLGERDNTLLQKSDLEK